MTNIVTAPVTNIIPININNMVDYLKVDGEVDEDGETFTDSNNNNNNNNNNTINSDNNNQQQQHH
eukprot:UN08771